MQFSIPNPPYFKVELLPDGIIYVTRRGKRLDEGIENAVARGTEIIEFLRKQGKPVLILNNTRFSNAGPRATELTMHLDFDRWAIYGASARYGSMVKLRLRANAIEEKFAFFETKDEATAWLHAFRSGQGR